MDGAGERAPLAVVLAVVEEDGESCLARLGAEGQSSRDEGERSRRCARFGVRRIIAGRISGNRRREAEGRAETKRGRARQEIAESVARGKGKLERAKGRAERAVGDVTGDEEMQARGSKDVAKGRIREKLNE